MHPSAQHITDNHGTVPHWIDWLDPIAAARSYLAAHPGQDIFDQKALGAALTASAHNHPQLGDFRAEILEHVRTHLEEGKAELASRLYHTRDGAHYVGMHALLMDRIIQILASTITQHYFPTLQPITIMATGGYGRGELAPFSDIDLMFVAETALKGKAETRFIETILYVLWDLGLKVGHATRTISENIAAAKEDITICTSLIEMRFIAGSEALGDKQLAAFKKWLSRQPVPEFVSLKLAERDERILRHGGSRYAVEPNVKEGKGGVRDLHTLFWIAKFSYHTQDIYALLKTEVLRESEARKFAESQRFLWTVRCFVHLHHGRLDDRLTFDAQTEIAPVMKFKDKGGLRAVERFMKYYFLTARQVGDLTRIFCAAIGSDFAERPRFSLRSFLRSSVPAGLDIAPFILLDGRLHLPAERLFRDNFSLIVRIFYLAQKNQLDIHPDSVRRITRAVRAARTSDLHSSRAFETFLEILTDSETPERVLRLMNESMWLGKFLPDFRRIVGMMQFDMYHSYTVDEHTLKAVGFLGEIEHGHLADVAPLATAIISKINSRRALYVAMLLHDIAKGRGGDHSELGAEVAAQLCPILGLSDEETETVIWLVRYHLLMSNTAFRYDLNDPQTIEDFAEQVQSPERLKLLLCLTVADIQAVGPAIWNGWKASLMRQLYHRAEAVLGGAAPTEVSAQAVSDSIEQLAEALPDWSSDELHSYVDQFYPSYWTNFRLDSHLYHAGLVRRFDSSKDRILIDFKDDESSNSTILCVMASDHPGLFSRIVGSVAISGCSIVNARINTRQDGTILDQFRIQKDRQAVTDPYIKARLSKLIEQSLAGDISLFGQLKEQTAKRSRRVRVMDVPPRIIVTNKRSRTHTVIEVNGPDRPGLLYQIAYHLAQLNLQINSATVSTYGEKAVDVFYVKDVFGLQITKQITQDKIHATLTGIFDS